jgi:hypothetical protein
VVVPLLVAVLLATAALQQVRCDWVSQLLLELILEQRLCSGTA